MKHQLFVLLTAGAILFVPIFSVFSQSPGGVSGANFWYKANDGVTTGATFTWGNLGVFPNANALQATSANQPTHITAGSGLINSNPVVSFDGTDDFLSTAGTLNNYIGLNTDTIKSVSQFVVYRKKGTNKTPIYAIENVTSTSVSVVSAGEVIQEGFILEAAQPVLTNEVTLIDMVATTHNIGSVFDLQKNGVLNQFGQQYIYNAAPDDATLKIAKSSSVVGNADIAEIIIYPTALSTEQRNRIQSYLALKYGISLGANKNQSNYTSSAGAIIWAANNTYKYDIFGIGSDSGSGLSQASSASINTVDRAGNAITNKGSLKISNPSSLDYGDFLIVGSNNGALSPQETNLPDNLMGEERLVRQWKVKHTGNIGTVTLSFSTLGINLGDTDPLNYKILIDTDGDGDFTTGTPTSVTATSFAANTITFDGVTLVDGAVFTFVTGIRASAGSPGLTAPDVWFKANQGVSASSSTFTWTNQGTLTNSNVTQSTNNAKPVVVTTGEKLINHNPVLEFDGGSDFLITTATNDYLGTSGSDKVASQFVVYRTNSNTELPVYMVENSPHQYIGAYTDGKMVQEGKMMAAQDVLVTAETALIDMVATTSSGAGTFSLHKNGVLNQSGPTATYTASSPAHFCIAKSNINGHDKFGKMDVAEIVLFKQALSAENRNKVQSYLALKYGISLGNNSTAVDYVATDGVTIWAADNTYKYDIFGIGKDSGSKLTQPVSNSMNTGYGDGTNIDGKANITLSEPSSLDDFDFLMLGHNNAALSAQTTDLPASTPNTARLTREWKVKHTGNVGTVTLVIDLKRTPVEGKMGSSPQSFSILIDEDGDGNFTTGTVSEVAASSVNRSILTFNDVTLPNNAVFTISMDLNNEWTGATSSDWTQNNNWSKGSKPTNTSDITITSNPAHKLVISTAVSCKNVVLEGGAELTIATGGTLHPLGNLTLINSTDGAATILNSGTISPTGTTSVIQQLETERNYYLASPVNGATVADNMVYQGYTEPTAVWTPSTETQALSVAKGYIVHPTFAQFIHFEGGLNNGNISVPLTRTTGVTKEGFNLIGNPYPSYLDWQMLASNNNTKILPTFWFRTKNTNDEYVFTTVNTQSGTPIVVSSGANTTITKFIPPAQAFWVRVVEGLASTSINFTNAMRSHNDVAENKLKAPAISATPLIRVDVSNDVNNDEAVLYFNSNATDGFDYYDSPKMFNDNISIPEVYFVANNEELSINGLKSIAYDTEIPLGIITHTADNNKLKIAEFVNFEVGTTVWLKNNQTNTETNITSGNAVTLPSGVISDATSYSLKIKSSVTGASTNELKDYVQVYCNKMKQINIMAYPNTYYSVYTSAGQLLKTGKTESINTVINEVYPRGAYLIQTVYNNQKVVKKLIVN